MLLFLPCKKIAENNEWFGSGGVVDATGEYIAESGIKRRVFGSYPFEMRDTEYVDETVVYCGYLNRQWGHFLMENTVRLWPSLLDTEKKYRYCFITDYDLDYSLNGNYLEFFKLLGVDDRIMILNKPTRFAEVIVPEASYRRGEYYSDEFLNIFDYIADNVGLSNECETSKKVFLTRSQFAKSQHFELGMDMLNDFFEKNGFELVSPEKISLAEMIRKIKNADLIACVSGTLPHNILFSKAKNLLILERTALVNDYQVDVDLMKELDTTYVDANICIYPVNLGMGSFIMAYEGQLKKYSEKYNFVPPDSYYTSESFLKKCFVKYMKTYRKHYGYRWHMHFDEWFVSTECLYEAYEEAEERFHYFIDGDKPFLPCHYFQIEYWKKVVKNIKKKF